METNYKEVKECRICGSERLEPVLNLGLQSVIAFPEKQDAELPKAPLEVVMCSNCTMLQLRYSFNKEMLYREYWYESGTSPTMVRALKDVVDNAINVAKLDKGDTVLDIACNDGTLLNQYPDNENIRRIGVDPSNVIPKNVNGLQIINDFFPSKKLEDFLNGDTVKIITCCAAFYDILKPNEFVEGIRKILKPNGIFVVQMNYLGLMVENKTYDDICIEHELFYSLKALELLLGRHGMEVIDLELNDVNGGSIRAYIKQSGSALAVEGGKARVERLRLWERSIELDRLGTYQRFSRSIEENRQRVLKFIGEELKKGKVFHIRGASTRGLTQVQFMGLTNREVKFVEDANPRKWDRFYADTKIRIIRPDEAAKLKADYKIVLPYHFIAEISNGEKPFLKEGGKLIVLIPEFRVIAGNQ